MIGSVVDGKYEVIRLLGQGGMGAVFEVRHVDTNRHLALKVIRSAEASKQRALVLRLQREARAAGSIDSPHIGQVIDAGTDPATETPYLVMELLLGEDVQQVLDRVGTLEPDVALRIVIQACMGLEKAHESKVVHRDIKPANLFLARQSDGELVVKVLDFGIAKLKQEDLGAMESGSLTRTGSVLGSPLYMSPEQARGAKAIDHRADLWSLGVVAYQLLTGRTPYQEIEALGELILAICSELPPCVQDFAPWVDPKLASAVHKALSLDAMERYQTAEEMTAALCEHLPRGADGQLDLKVREDLLVSPDEAARSVAAPRLIAEMGRRPAITTRPRAQHVVTPSGAFESTTGNRSGDRSSAAELEAGPTLMLAPPAASSTSQSGAAALGALTPSAVVPAGMSTGSTSQSGADARTGTVAGVSHSSPAEPRGSRGPLLAGVAAAALIVGIGVAVLGQGAMGGTPAAPTSAAVAPTAVTPAEVIPPVATPAATSAATPAPSAAPVASAEPAPSASASASASPRTPAGPAKGPTAHGAPSRTTTPAAPATAAPVGTSGFGDRK